MSHNEGKVRGALQKLKLTKDAEDEIVLGGMARYFMTVNEPAVVLFNGYLGGIFPPYKRGNILTMKRVLNRLVDGHDIAFEEIKQGLRSQKFQPQVGAGYNWQYFEGALGKIAHGFQEYCTNRFERDGMHSDFLGLHYYCRRKVPLLPGERARREYSDQPAFGDVYPPGVLQMIRQMHHQHSAKPIFVSEFGFSDKDDLRRPYWILETVRYITESKQMGIPIEGFLLWTLVDNFEWDLGMSQKFGLFSESQLHEPLVPPKSGISSWQAWRAATKALRSPSAETLLELQRCRSVAYDQYRQAGGKY
jgi:beta-glucosidase/6-phospho-beta-glucosidase/beta-galactosidase